MSERFAACSPGLADAAHDEAVPDAGRDQLPRLRPRLQRHAVRRPAGAHPRRELLAAGRGGLEARAGRPAVDRRGQVGCFFPFSIPLPIPLPPLRFVSPSSSARTTRCRTRWRQGGTLLPFPPSPSPLPLPIPSFNMSCPALC